MRSLIGESSEPMLPNVISSDMATTRAKEAGRPRPPRCKGCLHGVNRGALCRGHDTPACWFAGCADWRRSRCGAPPHRPEGKAGFRNRPSREGRVIKLRWVFSACSARSSHCCCSCSNFALVTGSTAASAAVAHLRANCRRYSGRALIQSNRRGLFTVTGTALPFPLWRRNSGLLHSPRTGITKKGLLCFKPWIEKVCGPAHNYPANPASLAVRLADLR
jgi:hypothetical protein